MFCRCDLRSNEAVVPSQNRQVFVHEILKSALLQIASRLYSFAQLEFDFIITRTNSSYDKHILVSLMTRSSEGCSLADSVNKLFFSKRNIVIRNRSSKTYFEEVHLYYPFSHVFSAYSYLEKRFFYIEDTDNLHKLC